MICGGGAGYWRLSTAILRTRIQQRRNKKQSLKTRAKISGWKMSKCDGTFTIRAGMIQGAILWPSSFFVFINELILLSNALFADDLDLMRLIS